MKTPWQHSCCILCLETGNLSEEHLIPKSIGGSLTCRFLCNRCNSIFGQTFEAKFKTSPAIRLAIENLSGDLQSLYTKVEQGQNYKVDLGPETRIGKLNGEQIRGTSRQLSDGSLIVSEDHTKTTLENVLQRDGASADDIQRAITLWENSGNEELVQIGNGVSVKKWNARPARPHFDGSEVNPLVLLKIAYEFAILICGEPMLADSAELNNIRSILSSANDTLATGFVETLPAKSYAPFHGICFEGNNPEATFQIRLFGKLAYRVKLLNVGINIGRIVYTHDLKSGEETIHESTSAKNKHE